MSWALLGGWDGSSELALESQATRRPSILRAGEKLSLSPWVPLVEVMRVLVLVSKDTQFPSALIEGLVPWATTVVTAFAVSLKSTWVPPTLPAARSVAEDWKAIFRPLPLRLGRLEGALPAAPLEVA